MKYEKKPISAILRSDKTIFTFKDISLMWGDTDKKAAIAGVSYYVKTGQLVRLRRGIYAKDKNYNKLELATRIFTPSYVSFETVLGQSGVTFQHYGQIFVASHVTREITVDGQTYSYKTLKNSVLTNAAGILSKNNYAIASPERAFLDVLYLNKDYHFDNLAPLNWEKAAEILPVYGGNKRMEKMVKMFQKQSAAA